MNGYRVTLVCATEANGKWSHNNFREIIIEAENSDEAKYLATLRASFSKHHELANGSVYDVSEETIYRIDNIGIPMYQIRKYYQDDPKERHWEL